MFPVQRNVHPVDGSAAPALEQTARVVLAADAGSVQYARLFVRRCCEAAALDGDACEDAVLLTSEAVTEALLRGCGRPRLAVTTLPGRVRVEVTTSPVGDVGRPVGEPDDLGEPRRAVVERLASAWGARREGGAEVAWFDVSASDPDERADAARDGDLQVLPGAAGRPAPVVLLSTAQARRPAPPAP